MATWKSARRASSSRLKSILILLLCSSTGIIMISFGYTVDFGARLAKAPTAMMRNCSSEHVPAAKPSHLKPKSGCLTPSVKYNVSVDIPGIFQLIKEKAVERCIIQPFKESSMTPGILRRYGELRMHPKPESSSPGLISSVDRPTCFLETNADKLKELGETIQAEIHKLQNPPNCSNAKKLVFQISQRNGFTGIMHYVAHALMFAYGTQRTLVLKTSTMAYGEGAWEEYILPLSNRCLSARGHAVVTTGNEKDLDKLKRAPIVEILIPRLKQLPAFSPPLIPRHILAELRGVACDPAAWWTGQFMRYIFKPNKNVSEEMHRRKEMFSLGGPVVGLHIRRGDKLKVDSGKHEVEEYMGEVEKYFQRRDVKEQSSTRKVYLATDDVGVIDEIMNKYPNYTFLSDRGNAMTGGNPRSVTSLADIIVDLYLLTQSSFLVCTFSSGVCRSAYELMISQHPERCGQVRSLDCNYYFYKRLQLPMVANSDHEPSSAAHEIAFRKGDLIYSYGILGEGYSAGVNLNQSDEVLGVYPAHKTDTVYVPVDVVT